MVTDAQVRKLVRLDREGLPKGLAAAKAGLDLKTARSYRRLGRLPTEVRRMDRDWRTRPDPFADVWPQLEELLRLNPGLEAKTLFTDLQRRFPGRFADGQLRTLQRHVKRWRGQYGPPQEVFFAQVHHPGRLSASDFTHGTDLHVTIAGVPFDHLAYHFVLTYSNWETGTVCFAESYESLSDGLQNALWELGGVPSLHRTDRLTAAVPPGTTGAAFNDRYQALLRHYGLQGQAIRAAQAYENGDVEQSHRQFKRALDQALWLRGSRDFAGRAAYEAFLRQLFGQLNADRQGRLAEERPLLRPLPPRRLESCKRLRLRVGSGSTIHVEGNTYSVASRLIGERVEARVYAERVEVWYGQRRVEELPRLRGRGKHRIDYRHVIDWLVRKPGAFANYRHQADLFPSRHFRPAYDLLRQQRPERASREYVWLLHLAARESEVRVEAALVALLDRGVPPDAAAVEEWLRRGDSGLSPTAVPVGPVHLPQYDALPEGKEVADERGRGRDAAAAGVPEGAAPADAAGQLPGAGPAGSAGGPELRAVPADAAGMGVPGASQQAGAAVAARVTAAAGVGLAGVGPEAAAGQGGAAGQDAAGGVVRGAARERARLRTTRLEDAAFALGHRPGAGADRAAGAVHQVRPAGAAPPGRQAGPETAEDAEAAKSSAPFNAAISPVSWRSVTWNPASTSRLRSNFR
jgi:hypothetical protein